MSYSYWFITFTVLYSVNSNIYKSYFFEQVNTQCPIGRIYILCFGWKQLHHILRIYMDNLSSSSIEWEEQNGSNALYTVADCSAVILYICRLLHALVALHGGNTQWKRNSALKMSKTVIHWLYSLYSLLTISATFYYC